ncbi:uncharacterized protein KQ657_001632 [Scheffersomyces spartinae]|uniref:Methyltransferase type 11 domain-containing protein n=1 Tax=Scheffersomyces spartinae TaxID=45513 RepID=A0A9P8AHI1_9ASCO|nr:uncharacterized protein KQ657_001632 [Scheffersomyces spartinae]KAG7192537.1 hypothetical protein KQ657_001632 [Scheffersomyces spartinae]
MYWLVLIPIAVAGVAILWKEIHSVFVFCWACFIRPLFAKVQTKPTHQQDALEHFYKSQAHVYDKTRTVLLKGREECLRLAVSHLPQDKVGGNLVWIDVGGGTGSNIEYMDHILLVPENFKAVYLVDLSPSLCAVAKQRFANRKGWENKVHVLVADACNFSIEYSKADLITFSYSLSMIPTFNAAIDNAVSKLDTNGIIACVDFGIQSSDTVIGRINTLGGLKNRESSWILRNFWRIWFEADKVYLDSARRNYLEYKFGTIKSLNTHNTKLGKIPYYIWIGCDKSKSELILHRLNCLATESPYLAPSDSNDIASIVDNSLVPISKGHEAALINFLKNLPYPSIYYQREIWRVYFDELNPHYQQFKNQYIYAFTWEDPREDHKILKFNSNDTVLAITSAGDNILHYASLPNPPKRIHAVDLNPAQNHLLELKLASFRCLSQEQIWQLFGEGKCDDFQHILIDKLSPHMSSNAFQFWMEKGHKTFVKQGLYDTGSTRWALRLTRWVFKAFGVSKYVDELCQCTSIQEQKHIWKTKLKPALFNPVVSLFLVGNPLFLWKALGVPANQAAMMGDSVLRYVVDTLDPLIERSLISSDNYFYYLCLQGRYTRDNCPDYLSSKGYKYLTGRATNNNHSTGELSSPIDNIRLHTDFLNDVFARLLSNSLTIAIIMDHMDWFDPNGLDAHKEISALKQALADNGRVLLRSAAQYPWYIKTFESLGFSCEPAAIRKSGKSIDRINMYASTWVCTKKPISPLSLTCPSPSSTTTGPSRRRMSSLKI